MNDYEPYATMDDAHREWHRNTGVPMGTPGCPQDACHPVEDYDEPHVLVRIPQWLARKENLVSREMIGHVLEVRGKGMRFEGHASARPSDNCHRCGREITNAVSRLVGYGPYCCDELGIPRDPDPALVDEYRRQIESVVWSGWLPRLRCEVLDADTGEPVNFQQSTVRAPEQAPWQGDDDGTGGNDKGDPPVSEPVEKVKLRIEQQYINIYAPYRFKDAIKALPGRRWSAADRCWRVPARPDSARDLMTLFDRCAIEVDDGVQDLLDASKVRTEAAAHKTATELPPIPLSKTDAWLHQRQAYWFAHPLDSAGLFMDMGTGKSKVVVDLVVNRQHKRVLIVCPKSVVGVWPREFERHGGTGCTIAAPRDGSVKKRADEIKRALGFNDAITIAVVNYESMWRGEMEKLLLDIEWDLVVLDESHRVKAPGGKASMFAARLGRRAKHRLVLTGTPMPHSPLDVYGQFRFLDPGIFGTSFARFRANYAVMGGYGGHEVIGYQRQDELAERMYRIGFRVMAGDVLDLPPVMHETRTAPMPPAARKIYDDLANDLFAEVEEGSITASNALVRLLRLQQVTSGYAPVEGMDPDDDVVLHPIDDTKENLLLDLLDDMPQDEPVVVFCRFTHDIEAVKRVCEKRKRRFGELTGRSKDGLTESAEMRNDIDVLGVQIQAGGVGIDLTRARYAVYYSTGFSLGDYEQSLARVHRPGQTRPTTYYHLEIEDSIDQRVTDALVTRKSVVEFVLGLAN